MSDETPTGGPGPDAGSDLEMTPQWGGAPTAGEGKPKHVAVRKKGDVGEAMKPSAADAEYKAEIAVASQKVAKERKLGIVLLVIVLLVSGGLAAWKIMKVEVSLSATVETIYGAGKATVDAKVSSSHDVQVGIAGVEGVDKKAVSPGDAELTFEIELKKLKLGANPLKVQILKDGKTLKETEVTAYNDFEVDTDTSKVANKPHNVYLNFKLPQGWKVRVNKQDYEPSAGGAASVPVSMEQVFSSLDRFDNPQFKLEVPVKIIRDNDHELGHLQKIDVMLPQARMDLGKIGDALVADGKKAVIAGTADPGAAVKVDGKDVEVAEDGTFTAKVKLPKNKGFKLKAKDLAGAVTAIRSAVEAGKGKAIKIVVKTPGKVPSSREILAVRGKGKVAKKFAKLASAKK